MYLLTSSVSVEIDNCYVNYVSLDQLYIWQDLLEEINTNLLYLYFLLCNCIFSFLYYNSYLSWEVKYPNHVWIWWTYNKYNTTHDIHQLDVRKKVLRYRSLPSVTQRSFLNGAQVSQNNGVSQGSILSLLCQTIFTENIHKCYLQIILNIYQL